MAEEKIPSKLGTIEQRVERRILVHVPVEITEIDGEGHKISEKTFIEDVSDFGCRFSARGPVEQGDTVAVKILGSRGNTLADEEPHYYEIMWVARNPHNSTVGARILQGEKLASARQLLESGGAKRGAK